jgi:hypothetical protein
MRLWSRAAFPPDLHEITDFDDMLDYVEGKK